MEVASVPAQPAAAQQPVQGDPAQQQQQTPAPEAQPQAPQTDPFLASRLGEMGDTMRQLLERMPAPTPEAEPNWAEQLGEIYGDTGVPDPQQLESYITQRAEHIANQKVAAIQGEVGEIRQTLTNREIDGLEVTYPELKDPQVAVPVIERAAQFGVPLSAELIKTVHLAMKAEALAVQETPATPGPGPAAQLEQGGGGAPSAVTQQAQTEWERIKNAGGGTSTSIF